MDTTNDGGWGRDPDMWPNLFYLGVFVLALVAVGIAAKGCY